ncbi:hypothetical protein bcgnr5378_29990 [Bacillus cereus]|uniref:Uncharacterized protein n=1 Tax=Bacillus cereus TaxID=1396 RepID=A0A161TAE7_BACCE|nr:type IV secretion system DNA-binding domain-containing protein [Bacillus cereus]KZD72114.1 hypothetical protein B4088_0575 [Bacillus cereus]HDR8323535.1 type IV secretion system DNA-binding domain-containing protein [Bacillus cereus]HDR8330165.1 type IV secretion system DNA-binding domain-containing protein [Bacillus cereus]HDR8332975.1 type IV secretion system DNA-binding domain-containing protein [Bacillus cereus]
MVEDALYAIRSFFTLQNISSFLWTAFWLGIIAVIFYYVIFAAWYFIVKKETLKMVQDGVLMEIRFERDSEVDVFAVEQMWQNFYAAMYIPWKKRLFKPQPHFTFEIKSEFNKERKVKELTFNVWVPEAYVSLIKTRILTTYPKAQFQILEQDYIPDKDDKFRIIHAEELGLANDSSFSIKQLKNFDVDPLTSITNSISSLENMEIAIVQLIARPEAPKWRKHAEKVLSSYQRTGKMPSKTPEWLNFVGVFFKIFFKIMDGLLSMAFRSAPPEVKIDSSSSAVDRVKQGDMLEKITRHPFAFQIRVLVGSSLGGEAAKTRTHGILTAFRELDGTHNFLKKERIYNYDKLYERIKLRYMGPTNNDDILTSIELASFAHLPNKTNQTPGMKRAGTRYSDIPLEISNEFCFANGIDMQGNFRKIGLDEKGRMRHMYITGMTGTGKSTIIENMLKDDIESGRGVILIDPHGELVDNVLAKVSATKRDDIFVLNPSDIQHPFGMNLLEITSADLNRREMEKILVIDAYITVMKRVFGEASIGPNTDDIFRMGCSAILEDPDGGGLLELLLMITSEAYRKRVIQYVKNPVVKNYWEVIFASLTANKNFLVQNLNAPLNKIRRFIANELVSNIICQKRSTINIADTMNAGGVILARFSRGDMGFENSALLGTMLVSKVQIAAMQRVNIPEESRVATYLYVDEFQNFVGDQGGAKSFAEILSEARKYKLGLVVANQFIEQLRQSGGNFLLHALFNNCGTTITFRVGGLDAPFFEDIYYDKETNTGYKANDLTNLGLGEVVMQIMLKNGMRSRPFMAKTYMPAQASPGANPETIIENSRAIITRPRHVVSDDIQRRMSYDTIQTDS